MAQSDRADLGKITAGSQKSGMLHSLFAAAAFGRRRLEMAAACALAIFSGKIILTCGSETPAGVSEPLFHEKGPNRKRLLGGKILRFPLRPLL